MRKVSLRRSLVKATTYRVVIMSMDFLTIYLFTGETHVAIGFMIVSNLYTSIGYFVHERVWANIRWGVAGA